MVSGPGTVTFGNANALSTTASFSTAGTYVLRLRASDSVLATTDDMTVTVNPAVAGTELTGQHYDGVNFQTLRLTRVDPTIDFDWASGSPAPNVNADNFTVRWTGQSARQSRATTSFRPSQAVASGCWSMGSESSTTGPTMR